MGAIFIHNKTNYSFRVDKSLEYFEKQNFGTPFRFNSGSWELYYYPKKLPGSRPQVIAGKKLMIVCGTAVMPHKTSNESLRGIYECFCDTGNIPGNLSGNYFILFQSDNSIKIFTDPVNVFSIFLTEDRNVFSSSFIALVSGLDSLHINRMAVTENIVTGSVTGNETVFNEVIRLNNNLNIKIEGIEFVPNFVNYAEIPQFRSRQESIKAQINILDEYFEGIKPLALENGVDTGLTGGYDSRLLLVLILRHFGRSSLQIHSHYRNQENRDFSIAEKLAGKAEIPFKTIPVKNFNDLSLKEFTDTFEKSLIFNDGQIRTNSYWYEQYNTEDYRREILKEKRLGFHGIGGEIFRNQERAGMRNPDFRSWIKYYVVKRYAGEVFYDRADEENLTDYIFEKLVLYKELGFKKHMKIDLRIRKMYMNHIYLQANRGLRTNAENKLAYFLSPFAEPLISKTALGATPFLGISMNYESDLINFLNGDLAQIESSYGYSFNKGESILNYFPYYLIENLLPLKFISGLRIIKSKRNNYSNQNENKEVLSYINHLTDRVKELGIPVNIEKILLRRDLAHLVLSTGYLLDKFEDKIII